MPNLQQPSCFRQLGCWWVGKTWSYAYVDTDLSARYVKDILKKTSRSVDQVTIQPDGKWELNTKKEQSSTPRLNGRASESDDDLIEITKSGDSFRMATPRAYKTPLSQQPSVSREASTSSVPPRDSNSSGKRPIAAVIDLTSSGDEDEEPVTRAPKRQFTSNGYGPQANIPVFRPAQSGQPRTWLFPLLFRCLLHKFCLTL